MRARASLYHNSRQGTTEFLYSANKTPSPFLFRNAYPLIFSLTLGHGAVSFMGLRRLFRLRRVFSLRLIQAQRSRDAICSIRSEPPIWEDTTLQCASKVLNLSVLIQSDDFIARFGKIRIVAYFLHSRRPYIVAPTLFLTYFFL